MGADMSAGSELFDNPVSGAAVGAADGWISGGWVFGWTLDGSVEPSGTACAASEFSATGNGGCVAKMAFIFSKFVFISKSVFDGVLMAVGF